MIVSDGIWYLTLKNVLDIHQDQIATYGGDSGIRDKDAIDGAINEPRQTYDGEDLYPSIFDKAGCLCYCLAEGQKFADGNKRTAVVSALTFLKLNGKDLPKQEMRIYKALIDIANGHMNKEDLSGLFRDLYIEHISQ